MRYIGIEYRRRQTAASGAQPTRVCILENDTITEYELENEMDEIDFVHGLLPVAFRSVKPGDEIEKFCSSHIIWRKVGEGESVESVPASWCRRAGKVWEVAHKVASQFEGLKSGDVVGIELRSSTERLAYALSVRAQQVGAVVCRVPSFVLSKERGDSEHNHNNARVLAGLVHTNPELFYRMDQQDRNLILVTRAYRDRMEALHARIAREQRICRNVLGDIFCSDTGTHPGTSIEAQQRQARISDKMLKAYAAEERKRYKEMTWCLERLPVYAELFDPIEGLGPAIAARLIVAICDIRRFKSKQKLKAYLGVHVMCGGQFGNRPKEKQFVRRSGGKVSNWEGDARKALWLLIDQFNRRPNSPWGKKFREIKAAMRAKHPHAWCKECSSVWQQCQAPTTHSRQYSDRHIFRMATWRTATKFVEWLWGEWMKLERARQAEQLQLGVAQ